MSLEQLVYLWNCVCLTCWKVVKKPNQAVLMIPRDDSFHVAFGSQSCQKLSMNRTTNRGLPEERANDRLILKERRPEVFLDCLARC